MPCETVGAATTTTTTTAVSSQAALELMHHTFNIVIILPALTFTLGACRVRHHRRRSTHVSLEIFACIVVPRGAVFMLCPFLRAVLCLHGLAEHAHTHTFPERVLPACLDGPCAITRSSSTWLRCSSWLLCTSCTSWTAPFILGSSSS